jgi:signal transduction histidine kinase
MLQKALAQVDNLTSLIADLSDAAAIASGSIPLDLKALDIAEVLQQATHRVAQTGARHTVLFDRPIGSCFVLADRHYLERVMAGLLDNACKFSPPETQVHVSLDTDDREVRFSIADSGIGVPSSERERVFELFYRASNAAETCTQGLGLGLFTARQIIAKHGGRIWLESERSKGSTFHVALPQCSSP